MLHHLATAMLFSIDLQSLLASKAIKMVGLVLVIVSLNIKKRGEEMKSATGIIIPT